MTSLVYGKISGIFRSFDQVGSPEVRVVLFDNHPDSTDVWRSFLQPVDIELVVSTVVREELINSHECVMVIVDQTAVQDRFVDAVIQTAKSRPNLLILVTGHDFSVSEVAKMMKGGVAYVLEKPLSPQEIETAIGHVLEKIEEMQTQENEFNDLDQQFSTLTSREQEVLVHVLQGVPNRQAAEILQVSVRTVESRRAKVYRKLAANNVAELVRKADRLEFLRKELKSDAETPVVAKNPIFWSRPNASPRVDHPGRSAENLITQQEFMPTIQPMQ